MVQRFKSSGYLAGQMLIAMPQMQDPRFARTVVYLCAHTAEGAMGLVVNRLFNALTFPDLLEQLTSPPRRLAIPSGCISAARWNPGAVSSCILPIIARKPP